MKEVLLRRYERNYRRLHKNNGHQHFLTECSVHKCLPNFTCIQPQIVRQLNLSSSQIIAHRFKQLSRTLQDEIEKNDILKNELNHNFSILSTLIHHETLGPIIKNIKNRIFKSEKNNDFRRNRAFT